MMWSVKKSIYINRKVLNSEDIVRWAKKQGFETCLPEEEFHVTVAYDQKKCDWTQLPLESDKFVEVGDPDDRTVEEFKGGAVVLTLYSQELDVRWAELIGAGLHWSWPDYRPHITITYQKPKDLDVSKIEPYDGLIYLGPENVEEIFEDYKADTDEIEL